MKAEFVFNDQRIFDEFCNSRCKYCGGFYPSEFRLNFNDDKTLKMPVCWQKRIRDNQNLSKRIPWRPKISDFFNLGKEVLAAVGKIADYKILKLSGGEIFLYDDIVGFIESINKNYAAIQLLTNGVALTPKKIDRLAALGNVYFQISLDGVSGKTNFARNGNDTAVEKILGNIKQILKNNIGLEINCVLTKYNTNSFEIMLRYFKGAKNFVLVPRPVRGGPRTILDFSDDQLQDFKKLVIGKYDLYSDILPPKEYLERLIDVMENGRRNWNCYVPFYVMGVDNYGDIGACTRTDDLPMIGNIFDNSRKIDKIFKSNKNYAPASKPEPCSYCIIQYEMMNLYTEGIIGQKEMEKIPSFKIPGVMARVDEIRKRLIALGMVK